MNIDSTTETQFDIVQSEIKWIEQHLISLKCMIQVLKEQRLKEEKES